MDNSTCEILPKNMKTFTIKDIVYIPKRTTYHRVVISDIQYAKADKGCIIIKTTKAKFVLSSTLKRFAEQLDDPSFLFIHRSYYVNVMHIEAFDTATVLINDETIAMSSTGYKLLIQNIRRIWAR